LHIPGHGWWYAVTVIDYYSRYLLACHFTPSYRAQDVTTALDAARAEAERWHGPLAKTPFLFTDNGSSFVARHFQAHIDGQYSHVRIQYRTPTQLGLLERFHQTLKTEEVYWQLYRSPGEARASLEVFRRRYNDIRPHWALVPVEGGDPVTQKDVYVHGQAVQLPKWQGWAKAARQKLEDMVADAHFPIVSTDTATTAVT
jgi:transposase InsO family protein